MPEDHRVIGGKTCALHPVDQARGRLGGIDRIEHNAFRPGKLTQRLGRCIGRHAVASAHVITGDDRRFGTELQRVIEQLSGVLRGAASGVAPMSSAMRGRLRR